MTVTDDATPATRSAFDGRHAPEQAIIDDCVHCGFCLTTCPTYALWGQEMDSPRGRIYLLKMAGEGEAAIDETFTEHFDRCLGCMACVTACPSGVRYDRLIEAARPQIERHHRRGLGDALFRRFIFALFPYPDRLRLAAWPLWLYQRSGAQRLARRSGLLKLLPARLQSMEALMPPLTRDRLRARVPATIPAQGERRGRAGLLLGCVQQAFFKDVNAATARVLAAEGYEVVAPADQGCCGALSTHAGQEDRAVDFARRTIDAFERANVDVVVINAAGCGSAMKEYAHLLRDDPDYAGRAADFVAKCRDISEVLAAGAPRAPRHPVPLRVAYHDACHLQHAQGIRDEPRRVLRSIPDLDVVEIAESALCCGSAGIYNLVEPQPARDLGDRKARNILATGAEAVVSSNPGCLLQIASGLDRAGTRLPVLHLVELVDASQRGVMPAGTSSQLSGRLLCL